MADNQVEVSIVADSSGLEASLAQAVQAMQDAFAAIVNSAQKANASLQGIADNFAGVQRGAHDAQNAAGDFGQRTASSMQQFNRSLQEGMRNLRTLAQLHQITAAEEAEAEIALTNTKFQEQLKALQNELLTRELSVKDYNRVLQEKAALEQRWATEIERINERAALNAMKDWQQILRPIEAGFDGMFRNMLTGSKSFQQSMAQVANNIVTSFVSSRIKIEFEWLAGQLAMGLGAQQWAEKSLLAWVATELGITSAQKTADATSVASKSAAAAATGAIAVGQATGQIMTAAAVAAANAYAATAAIPIVGPELAPEAAEVAYAGTAAWAGALEAAGNIAAGAPGLAVGAWEIPSTMLAVLHAGESVVPADFASGLRSSGVLGGAGGDVYSITIQAIDTQTGAQFLKNNMSTIVAGLARQRRNLNAALSG